MDDDCGSSGCPLHKLSVCQPCGAVGWWNGGFWAELQTKVLPPFSQAFGLSTVWCRRLVEQEDSVLSSKPSLPLHKIPELRSCVKVAVDILVSPSLIVPTVSVDVQQHLKKIYKLLL